MYYINVITFKTRVPVANIVSCYLKNVYCFSFFYKSWRGECSTECKEIENMSALIRSNAHEQTVSCDPNPRVPPSCRLYSTANCLFYLCLHLVHILCRVSWLKYEFSTCFLFLNFCKKHISTIICSLLIAFIFQSENCIKWLSEVGKEMVISK